MNGSERYGRILMKEKLFQIQAPPVLESASQSASQWLIHTLLQLQIYHIPLFFLIFSMSLAQQNVRWETFQFVGNTTLFKFLSFVCYQRIPSTLPWCTLSKFAKASAIQIASAFHETKEYLFFKLSSFKMIYWQK